MHEHTQNWSTEKRGEKGAEKIFKEIITPNFPNLLKNNNLYMQEALRTPSKINTKRPTNRHIRVKNAGGKRQGEKCLKESRGKMMSHLQGNPIRLTAGFQQKQGRPEGSGIAHRKC